MKKFFFCLMVVFAIFSVSGNAVAQNTSIMDPVFKIQGYSYDILSDMYVLEQYGSAVLLSGNILLTNAHVVTDSNDGLTLQYEACQTLSDQEAPKCFSTLQLLKYDKNSDLALLQIIDPSDNMPDPVRMGSGILSVGAAIRIVGYPANGGETITTTQGTIAGFEDTYYKTDANIDEGNSGGGSFDSAGEFIGIPTFIVKGQTSLGYIIPTSTIQKFINGTFATTYKKKYSVLFDRRLKSIYTIQSEGKIDNNLFSTDDFSEIGLVLDAAIEKKNNNFYSYSFSNENDSNVAMASLIATDNAAITKYINNSMKQLVVGEYSPKKTTKRIGTTIRTVISFGDDDRVGYNYIQTTSTNKTYLECTILVDKEDIDTDLSDVIAFVENTKFKKPSNSPQVFNLPMIKLSSKWNVGIVKYFNENGLSINIFPNNGKYLGEVFAYLGVKGDTLKSISTQLRNAYDDMGLTVTSETSKYPGTTAITSMVDEHDTQSLSILGLKKYGTKTIFIHITIQLNASNAKQEAINLGYKILGLE